MALGNVYELDVLLAELPPRDTRPLVLAAAASVPVPPTGLPPVGALIVDKLLVDTLSVGALPVDSLANTSSRVISGLGLNPNP